jgi:hypothetical protein
MPAGIRFKQANYAKLQRELKDLDKDLFNEFRRAMRKEMKPYAQELKSGIPNQSPLSGMARNARYARQSFDDRKPFVYKKPRARISVGSGRVSRSSRASGVSIVSIVFSDKRPFSAFSVMETAGARRPGNRVARSLDAAGFPLRGRGKGRFVLPDFYAMAPAIQQDARNVIEKYARMVSKRLARKF